MGKALIFLAIALISLLIIFPAYFGESDSDAFLSEICLILPGLSCPERGNIGHNKKRSRHDATTFVFQNWCRGRDSNPHSYCHYPLKIACLPVPPPRRRDALYAKPRRLASLFLQSIFSLKRCFSPASGRTALRRRLACYLFQRRNVLKKTAGPERSKACESRALRIHLLLTLGDCL